MTEPENFEEDLFADLYDDNDASKTGPGPQAAAPITTETLAAGSENAAASPHDLGQYGQDEQPKRDANAGDDDDDDDDEVDFNLGGGSTIAAPAVQHDDTPATPPYGTVHKASAKEDG